MKNAARPIHKAEERAPDARPAFRLRPVAYCVMLACCELALANPNGPQVISGNVQFQGLGTDRLSVTNSPGAIINWQGFSINAGQLTQFLQQNAASTVLNRVVGGNLSQIQGQLSSNGRVFLINPAGIVIGAGAVIDTAGFVGSTLNMLDADFLKGKLSFQGDGTSGSIVNQGFIKTTHGGDVVLVAPNIENSGIIHADGKIMLAAGHKLTIGSLDANDVQFEVQAPSDSVLNVGELLSKGGAVGAFAGTLRHTGDIRATAMGIEGGRVVLKSQGDTVLAGNSTTVATGDKGGTVQVLGDRVGIFESSKIDASGEHGGGTILVGGDYQGRNPDVRNASQTVIGPNAVLRANAGDSGDGGKVIVWADGFTRMDGTIEARGGALAGNGGFVETSGKEVLNVGDSARIDAAAPGGVGGTWLLDPRNITVQTGGGATTAQVDQFSDASGTDLTVSPATLLAGPLTIVLQANNDINFNSVLTSPANRSLIAQAGRSIFVNANMSFNDSSGITLIANETTAAGVVAAQRQAGAATLQMAPGTSITTGPGGGNIVLRMNAGIAGDPTKTSGDIVLTQVAAQNGSVSVIHSGTAAGGRILTTGTSPLISASSGLFLAIESSGGNSSIGQSGAAMQVSAPNIEARNVNGTGGIFIDSQRNLGVTIGNTGLSTGGLSGIQAPAGGPIELTFLSTASLPLNIFGGLAPCGSTGGGGPVCSGPVAHTGVNDTVSVRALDMTISAGMRGSTVTLLPSLVTTGTNNQVNLNAGPATNTHLHLSQAEINQISTSLLRVGDASSGDVSFADPSTFTAVGPLSLPGGTALEVRTGGNIISGAQTSDIIAPNTNVTLSAAGGIGVAGNRLLINPGTGTVNLNASTGGIFVEHTVGDMDLTKYVIATPSGTAARPLELVTTNGNIAATGAVTALSGPFDVTLTTGGAARTITLPNSGTYSVNSLTLAPTGTTALSGTQTFNAPVTTSASITSSGTTTFNGALDMNGAAGLTVTAGTTTIAAASDINGTLTISGTGTLAVNGDTTAHGNFSLLGSGTLTGTALLDLEGANNIWQGTSAMTGAGTTTILKGNLTISDASQKTFGARTLTIVAGSNLIWTGGGNISAGNGGTVNVPNGASFTISNSAQWFNGVGPGGTPTTLNLGDTLVRDNTGGVVALDAMVVAGTGTAGIDVLSGTLRLSRDAGNATGTIPGLTRIAPGATTLEFAGGAYTMSGNVSSTTAGAAGNLTISGGSLTTSGTVGQINALTASGGTATFGATAAIQPNSITVNGGAATFAGPVANAAGPLTLTVSSGSATFNAASSIAGATNFSGGTIGGIGALALDGGGTWSGGTMTGAGTTTVGAGGLTLSTGTHNLRGLRTFNVPLTNTATWNGGDIAMGEGATITIGGSAGWSDQNTVNVSMTNPFSGVATFANGGSYTKAGTGTTSVGTGVTFNNSGGVAVNAGTLRIGGGGTSTGTFAVPATLEFNAGNYDFNAGSVVSGAGTVLFSGATANVNGGTINLTPATGTTRVTGGAVTVAAAATATSLGAIDVGGGTLTLSSGEIIAPRTLTVSGGTIGGTDTLNVAGLTTWTGGTMTGAGTTNATNGLTISDGAAKTISGNRTLANGTGTATWSGGDTITFANGTISNAGLWTDQTAGASMTGTGGTFANNGTYTKTGGTTTTFGIAFNNAGPAVNVNAGTLLLSGGGTSSGTLTPNGTGILDFGAAYNITGGLVNGTGTLRVSGGTTTVSGGTYNIAGGATTVPTGGTLTLAGGATGTSVGALTINGGVVNLNSGETLAATALTLSAGTLGGTDRLDVSGATQWSGGTMTDAGETHANGGLTISGGTKNLSGGHSLNIPGGATTTWTATGGIVMAGGAAINTDGTWLDQTTDVSITGAGTFANGGSYQKTAPGTTTIAVPFSNINAVAVTAGTLRLTGGSGATNDTGTFSAGAGTTIDFGSGTHTLDTGAALTGTGTGKYLLSGGTLTTNNAIAVTNFDLTGGILTGAGALTLNGTGNWTSGSIDAGQLIVAPAATLAISGNVAKGLDNNAQLVNQGATTWSGTGNLIVSNGSSITNAAGGQFNVQNDQTIQANAGVGSFVNAGTFTKTVANGDTTFGSGIPVTNNGGTFDTQTGNVVFGFAGNAFNGGSFIGAGTNRVQAASAFSGTIHATNLVLALGTLTGTSTFDAGSTVSWTGGTFDQAGTTTFAAGSVLNISGTTNKGIDNGHVLALFGGTNWTGTGNLVLARNATINNQPGAVFNAQNDQSITVIAGTATFNNAGAFNKNGGSTGVTTVQADFNNTGAVDVSGGTLILHGGTHSSAFNAAAGAAIQFGDSGSSVHVLGAGTQLNSAGTGKYVMSAGTLTANTAIGVSNFDLNGGTLNGSGTVTLNGSGNWTGGTIDGATGAQLVVAGPASLAISGATAKALDHGARLTNQGATTWSGTGDIIVSNGSSITNANLFVAQTDRTMQANAGAGSFVNTGTFRKTGNAGDTTFGFGMPVTSTGGTFDAQTGRIVFGAAGNAFTGTSFLSTGAGTGASRIQGNSTLDGTIHATSLDLASGTVTGTRTFDTGSVVTWSGGTLDQAGITTFAQGSALNISGGVGKLLDHGHALALGGTTTWSGTGGLTVNNGSQITNQPSGQFNVQNDQTLAVSSGTGTFINQGTLNKTAGGSTTQINTAFTNPGTINVSSGTLQVNTAFPNNPGTINVSNGAAFSTNGAALTNDGTIGGEGTLNLGGATLTNNNVLRPGAATGDTTGTLNITGNLVQTANARVDFELGGTSAGSFDAVVVSGSAALTGTVNVTAVGGYTSANGDTFQAIAASSRTGNFRIVNKSFAAGMRSEYGTGLQFIIDPTTIDTFISTDTDWTVPGNWNLGHVPGVGETALIPDLPGTPTIAIASGMQTPDRLVSSESLQIAGGTLSLAQTSTITGNLTLDSGALQGAGPLSVSGTTTVNGGTLQPVSFSTGALNAAGGTINVPNGGLLALTGGGASSVSGSTTTLANAGTFRVAGGGSFTVSGGASFANAAGATLDVQNGSATLNGFTSNPGTILLGGGSTLSTSGGFFTNTGAVSMVAGSTFNTGGNSFINANGATVSGSGTFNLGGATFANNGTFSPGASPGTMNITGDYTQSPTGTLVIEVGGPAAGTQFDVVNVTGIATLAGTLDARTLGGFRPVFGDRFDVMTFASRVGDFTTFLAPASTFQQQPTATTYTLAGLGLPPDDTANQLRRLREEMERAKDAQVIEEPNIKGGRQICD